VIWYARIYASYMVIKVSLVSLITPWQIHHNPLNTSIVDHSRCLHWWVCLLTTGQTSGCIVGVSPSGCIRGVFSGCILNTAGLTRTGKKT
jgi:hypothetical protein